MNTTRFRWLFPFVIALLILSLSIPVVADVSFSKENQGESHSVFIAGNPDLYPIEYFNPKTQRYEGVMPMLFEQISQACDIDFTYIYTSPENKQQYLAQNGQVDIVSAYVSDQISEEYVPKGSALLSFSYNGKTQTVMVGFTSVCDEAIKEKILTYLESISAEELTELTVSFVMSHEKETADASWIWWIAGLVALICIAVLSLLLHRNRKRLAEQKNFNPRNGLYNKSYLDEILYNHIHDFIRKRYYAVCISVNQENLLKYYGKDQWNALADYMAHTLKAQAQEREFCVQIDDISVLFLLQAPNPEQAEVRVSELIKKLNSENGILNDDYRVTISAGCYGLMQMRENGERVLGITTEAYSHAEANALPYFFVDSQFIKMVDRKALLQKETVQAIKKEQILFYLQYIVDIQRNVIIGAEALSRWEHPREGLLFPGAYIQLMQQAKNIHLLDFYMLEKCCQQLLRWDTDETRALSLSCNFDRQTAAREDFCDRVIEIVDKYKIDRSRLILEITEETFIYNKENVMRNTMRLRDASFRVALDDFGSGSSYFQNIIEYHVSHLKLDRIFVEVMQNEQGKKLVRGIVTASHELGLHVLQEGVECHEELQVCRELGIDMVQGYVFSRVVPGIEGDRVRRRLMAHLEEENAQAALPAYAEISQQDAEEESGLEEDDESTAFGIRYRWSFRARLHRAPEEVASYYSSLKNEFLKYKKVRARISWNYDTISYRHAPVAKFVMRQKALLLYLALPPAEFEESKYFFVDASDKKKYEQVPLRLKIRGSRGFKHATELVEELAKRLEWKENTSYTAEDHTLPPRSVEELIAAGLIKINGKAATPDILPPTDTDNTSKQKNIACEIASTPIVTSISEGSFTEETDMNMNNNNNITQNIAEFIYDTYYRWSFTARLHQAPENVSAYYNDIKNALLRYKRVKSRVSWSCDTISFGKDQLAKFVLTQKTLYVYLALSPKDLEGTKYFFTDESDTKKYERVPIRVRVRSDRGVKYTIELIEMLAQMKGLQLSKNFTPGNYILPHESVETLLDRQLIKKVEMTKHNAESVDETEESTEAVATAVVSEETPIEETPIEETPVEDTPVEDTPVEDTPVEEAPAEETPIEETPAPEETTNVVEQVTAQEAQNANLTDADAIPVAFLQNLCRQFDADELNAHIKVIYKKKKEKKTSIFDVVMKKNRP